jgi:hypothetical protein
VGRKQRIKHQLVRNGLEVIGRPGKVLSDFIGEVYYCQKVANAKSKAHFDVSQYQSLFEVSKIGGVSIMAEAEWTPLSGDLSCMKSKESYFLIFHNWNALHYKRRSSSLHDEHDMEERSYVGDFFLPSERYPQQVSTAKGLSIKLEFIRETCI